MRHVKKIDFEMKNVVVHNDLRAITEFFVNKKDLKEKFKEGIVPANEIQESKRVYDIYEVFNPYRSPNLQYYAVQEKELLNDILSIGKTVIETMERKQKEQGFNEGRIYGYNEGITNAIRAIKKLPWYKRLFNVFK